MCGQVFLVKVSVNPVSFVFELLTCAFMVAIVIGLTQNRLKLFVSLAVHTRNWGGSLLCVVHALPFNIMHNV